MSDTMLYNSTAMLKIDLFMMRLARNYWNSIRNVLFNSLIPYFSFHDDQYFELSILTIYHYYRSVYDENISILWVIIIGLT